MKNKFVFIWNVTDGVTYSYNEVIPFETDDIVTFILNVIESVEKSEWGIDLFGITIYKNEIDNFENRFFRLDEWFNKNKFVVDYIK